MRLRKQLKKIITGLRENVVNPLRVMGKQKVFCIGMNKTGTTSLKKAFEDLGFIVGNQRNGELLADAYFKGNFLPILRYCKTAQVFQDVPFSYPDTFRHLDIAFPHSKFILTIRDSPEAWYSSVVRFHAKLFGGGHIPNYNDLAAAKYVKKGWMLRNVLSLYGTTEEDPYERRKLIDHYERYNENVIAYFKERSDDLLVINLAHPDAYARYCEFLGVETREGKFPWENKTDDLKLYL